MVSVCSSNLKSNQGNTLIPKFSRMGIRLQTSTYVPNNHSCLGVTTSCRFMGTAHWCPKIMWNISIGFVLLPSLKVVVSVRILFLHKSATSVFIHLLY